MSWEDEKPKGSLEEMQAMVARSRAVAWQEEQIRAENAIRLASALSGSEQSEHFRAEVHQLRQEVSQLRGEVYQQGKEVAELRVTVEILKTLLLQRMDAIEAELRKK